MFLMRCFFKNCFQGSPNCVCSFIVLEIIYVLGNIIWELYFIITYYSDEGRFNSYYYDNMKSYDYMSYDYEDLYYGIENKYKKYTKDDLFWLGPVLFFRKDIVYSSLMVVLQLI